MRRRLEGSIGPCGIKGKSSRSTSVLGWLEWGRVFLLCNQPDLWTREKLHIFVLLLLPHLPQFGVPTHDPPSACNLLHQFPSIHFVEADASCVFITVWCWEVRKRLGWRYGWGCFEPWLLQEEEVWKGKNRAGGLYVSSDAMASAAGENLLSAVAATHPCEAPTLIRAYLVMPRFLLPQQSAVLPLRRFKDNMALWKHRIF